MTIKDLAKKTGYGVATVSRVLNGHHNVSEKAKRIILAEAKNSNFEINTNAQQLKQQQSNTVLVVVKGQSNEMFAKMVEVIQQEVEKTGYPLYVDYMDEDANEVLRAVTLCKEKKPIGILFLGGNSDNFIDDFGKIEIPCVLVSNSARGLDFENLSSVCTDDFSAAKAATDALIKLGHRKFAIVGGDIVKGGDTGRLRYRGCIASFKEHKIDFNPKFDYVGVRFSYQDGYNATEMLIKSKRKFTALFAAADVMAIGAIRALKDHGLRVPEDVSVMGFDGLELGSYLVPKLSTVGQNTSKMARRSVEMLVSAIEKPSSATHEIIPFTVLKRESTKEI